MNASPLALPLNLAGAMLLAGVAMGLVALGTGWLALGAFGLSLAGLASGLLGNRRQRLCVAGLLWLGAAGLVFLGAALGPGGFTLVGPVLLCLWLFALGQFAGLLAGLLVLRPARQGDGGDWRPG